MTLRDDARRLAIGGCAAWVGVRRGWRRRRPPVGRLAVIGFLETASGLGRAARGLLEVVGDLDPIGVSLSGLAPTARVPVEHTRPWCAALPGTGVTVAIHVYNPDIFLALVRHHGSRMLVVNEANVALINWETRTLPAAWPRILSLYDGLCASSTFTADAVERATGRAARVVPLHVPLRPPRVRRRDDDHYELLCLFDHHSDVARKHPFAAVESFRQASAALPRGVTCRLRVKCHAGTPAAVVAALRETAAGAAVDFITETLSDAGMDALWERTDCLLSLHRSEGFGLPVAEALARGIPVIATRQGGILDFVDDDGCLLIDGPPARHDGGVGGYAEWSGWVEPDVGSAAAAIRTTLGDYPAAVMRAARGRARIGTTLSAAAVRAAVERVLAMPRPA